MTALGKLFRATAFRLALAILALSAVGAGIVLTVIAWQVVTLVDEEIARTIDAEAKGLIDSYDHEGLDRPLFVIETRKRQPGASLYLLTDPAGEPLAGNVEQIPLDVLERPGLRRSSPTAPTAAATGSARRSSGSTSCRPASCFWSATTSATAPGSRR